MLKADEKPVRDVTGEDVRRSKRKKLLRTRGKGDAGRDQSCEVYRADEIKQNILSVKLLQRRSLCAMTLREFSTLRGYFFISHVSSLISPLFTNILLKL